MFLLAALPPVLAAAEMGTFGRVALGVLRFPGMVLFMAASLSILYHLGPDRPERHRFRWITWGSVAATVLWVIATGLLSIYFATLSGDSAGGTELLVTLTMLMIFLQVTSFCVLLGAEFDATRELLDRRDSDPVPPATPAPRDKARSALAAALIGAAIARTLRRQG